MKDRELGLFLNWFIRHYSTETTTDRGLMYYANSMGEEVSIAEILQHYNNETFNTKEKMVEDEIDYKKEYYRLYQEVAKMLVENRRNYETPMTPFELLSRWDKIREVKNTFNTKEK